MNTKASEAKKRADRSNKSRLLRKALEYAWTDFVVDVRSAVVPGSVSMSMEWRIEWIKELSEAIGPISWEHVEMGLLESGWFQRIHEQLGYPVDHEAIRVALVKYGRIEEPE
jgi:hypothetical protein